MLTGLRVSRKILFADEEDVFVGHAEFGAALRQAPAAADEWIKRREENGV